jgi:hypothetical protein
MDKLAAVREEEPIEETAEEDEKIATEAEAEEDEKISHEAEEEVLAIEVEPAVEETADPTADNEGGWRLVGKDYLGALQARSVLLAFTERVIEQVNEGVPADDPGYYTTDRSITALSNIAWRSELFSWYLHTYQNIEMFKCSLHRINTSGGISTDSPTDGAPQNTDPPTDSAPKATDPSPSSEFQILETLDGSNPSLDFEAVLGRGSDPGVGGTIVQRPGRIGHEQGGLGESTRRTAQSQRASSSHREWGENAGCNSAPHCW